MPAVGIRASSKTCRLSHRLYVIPADRVQATLSHLLFSCAQLFYGWIFEADVTASLSRLCSVFIAQIHLPLAASVYGVVDGIVTTFEKHCTRDIASSAP
jgi:hypothetical protein